MAHRLQLASENEGSIDFTLPMDEVFGARLTMGLLYPDELKLVPRTVLFGGARVPDILGMSIGPYIICETLKLIIERLEPNTHNFIDIHLKRLGTQGTTVEQKYYLLCPPPIIDAVSVDHTDFVKGFGRSGYDSSGRIKSIEWLYDGAIVFVKRNAVAGRHFWRLPAEYHFQHMCSDALWHEIVDERISGWISTKYCQEV